MAPYLLLGFLIAGVLRAFFNEAWVKQHLGQRGVGQIFKAVVIGIPLPLCSCGVIPVAAAIRAQGGQRGAVAAFTASTPQTGVDSIAATVGMLGWPFAILRVGLAFLNGIIAGLVVERWGDVDVPPMPKVPAGNETPAPAHCCGHAPSPASRLLAGMRFGLLTLPKDLFMPLVIGLLLAGVIATVVPEQFFSDLPGGRFALYTAMTLIALPLYICSTGSIPLAFSFLAAGMSPGAVLIFLIAGPASTAATVTSLWKIIGPRGTVGYIASIVITAWLAAIVIDSTGLSLVGDPATHFHHEAGINLFQHAMGGLLILVLLAGRLAGNRS
jgi:uncharacterized membrane protein YraQ (UPF0718 family)